MSNDATTATILSALEIAAFERRTDGSFVSLVPVPEWFSVLGRDQTFPFLGHLPRGCPDSLGEFAERSPAFGSVQ